MATVTGLTAERMYAIEQASVVSGNVSGDNLILVTRGGTQIPAGNVRGPKGDTGPPGPLTQAQADTLYVNVAGDTMTGPLLVPNGTLASHVVNKGQLDLKIDSSVADGRYVDITGDTMTGILTVDRTGQATTECIKLVHGSSPYLSFYNAAVRMGYLQHTGAEMKFNSEQGLPLVIFTNGKERVRVRANDTGEILTLAGDPDAILYFRDASPSGAAHGYIGKSSTWGMRATASAGDALLQASAGDTRIQASGFIDMYPGATFAMRVSPAGHVTWNKTVTADDTPGMCFRSDLNALRVICNVSGPSSIYLNRRGAGAGVGEEFLRFDMTEVKVGSITRTSSGVAYNVTSDYRVKDVHGPITNALQKIGLLKPSRIVYHMDETHAEMDGLIAHEVAEVCPEAVTGEKDAVATEENAEMQGLKVGDPILQQMDASRLIPLLIASVQELTAKVLSLETKLAAT